MDERTIALGNCIRRLRIKRNYKQEEIADKANIERNYVSDIECGKSNISMKVLFALANALEVTATEIVFSMEQHKKGGNAYVKQSGVGW